MQKIAANPQTPVTAVLAVQERVLANSPQPGNANANVTFDRHNKPKVTFAFTFPGLRAVLLKLASVAAAPSSHRPRLQQGRMCSRDGAAAGMALLQGRRCCRDGAAAGTALLQGRRCCRDGAARGSPRAPSLPRTPLPGLSKSSREGFIRWRQCYQRGRGGSRGWGVQGGYRGLDVDETGPGGTGRQGRPRVRVGVRVRAQGEGDRMVVGECPFVVCVTVRSGLVLGQALTVLARRTCQISGTTDQLCT